jgi:hypothetical protein
MPGGRPLAQHRRHLEAVQAGHLHVEQDQRELLLEQPPQRLRTRLGMHQALAERLEDRLQRHEICRAVVDQEDAGLLVFHGRPGHGAVHNLSSSMSSCELTGFAR